MSELTPEELGELDQTHLDAQVPPPWAPDDYAAQCTSEIYRAHPRLSATLRQAWAERDAAIRENGRLQAKLEAITERMKAMFGGIENVDYPVIGVRTGELKALLREIQETP